MTLQPFYQNLNLGPTPTFYYQPSPPRPPIYISLFLISQETGKTGHFLRTKTKKQEPISCRNKLSLIKNVKNVVVII